MSAKIRAVSTYYELGWFSEHPKITYMLRDNSPLMFDKSLERFLILFPTALIHIVACQNHPDMYFPDAVDVALVDVERHGAHGWRAHGTCLSNARHCTAGLDVSADFSDSRPIQAPRRKLVPVIYD